MTSKALLIPTLALTLASNAASAQDIQEGAALYREHCATCQGLDAMGGGPMAGVLTVKPRDLTQLTVDNGGVFPMEQVARRIDGRDPLLSHGSPMPVYGFFFEGADASIKTPSGQPMLTSQPIVDLLGFLQTLQQE
ncbi:MAG: cytochrome c [Paracoccaceae bacterium]